ncbi:MAG: hypothetical protein ACE5FI_17035, partial [Anaerolineales bacterium]
MARLFRSKNVRRTVFLRAVDLITILSLVLSMFAGVITTLPNAAATHGTADDPNPPIGDKYSSYWIEFETGDVISGTSVNNSVQVNVAGFDMSLHVSCSDSFLGPDDTAGTADDGYGAKEDPSEAAGHPRVTRYHIWRYNKGALHKECGADPYTPSGPTTETPV